MTLPTDVIEKLEKIKDTCSEIANECEEALKPGALDDEIKSALSMVGVRFLIANITARADLEPILKFVQPDEEAAPA